VDKGKAMPTNEITAKAQILVRRPREEVFNAFVDPEIMEVIVKI